MLHQNTPNPFPEASLYTTKPSVLEGRVNTGAVVSLLFNSWKLFSHSSDHTHFLFFLVSWVKGVALREEPSINLR
jgi:hypothetical protein